jgi:hypothetical protein
VDQPGSIPNPAVKRVSADGTWGAAPWESRPLPGELLFQKGLQCPETLEALFVFRPLALGQAGVLEDIVSGALAPDAQQEVFVHQVG